MITMIFLANNYSKDAAYDNEDDKHDDNIDNS